MKPLRPNKKWVLATFGLLLSLLIMKMALFLTAKPKITVNYIAEYNKTSRPQNYDPDRTTGLEYNKWDRQKWEYLGQGNMLHSAKSNAKTGSLEPDASSWSLILLCRDMSW